MDKQALSSDRVFHTVGDYARHLKDSFGLAAGQAGQYVGEHGKAFGTAGAGAGVLGVGGLAGKFSGNPEDAAEALSFGGKMLRKSRKFLGMGDDDDESPTQPVQQPPRPHLILQHSTGREKIRRLRKMLKSSRESA